MSLHVEKLRVPVRLSQPNLDPRDGCFLLFPRVGAEHRPESLLELLNSPRTVIPFVLSGDGTVLLVTRLNVDWVAVPEAVERHLVFPPDFEDARAQEVELRFVDERRVEALVTWTPNTPNQRLSDLLNGPEAFFAARAGFGTLIVNKLRVREMTIRDGTSAAAGEPWRMAG